MTGAECFAAAAAAGDVAAFLASLPGLDWRAAFLAVAEIGRAHPAVQ